MTPSLLIISDTTGYFIVIPQKFPFIPVSIQSVSFHIIKYDRSAALFSIVKTSCLDSLTKRGDFTCA